MNKVVEEFDENSVINNYVLIGFEWWKKNNMEIFGGGDRDKNKEQDDLETHQVLLGDLIGTIKIPKLTLQLPIYFGSTEDILSKGIGLIDNGHTSIGGNGTNNVLAGHSGYASMELFSNIHKLGLNDIFYINTQEKEALYSVIDKRKISITEIEHLQPQKDKDLVTLLTCPSVNSKSYRIIVIGEKK